MNQLRHSIRMPSPKRNLSYFQENFVTLYNSNGLYLKPTQVGKFKYTQGRERTLSKELGKMEP